MSQPAPQTESTALLLRRIDEKGIVTLTLNRPAQYNALSRQLLADLQAELDDIAVDPDVRVVVLAASGKAFCAGHDLREMSEIPDKQGQRELFQQCSRVMLTLTRMPQPVIARVQGVATAAGCQLVATCDLAVAAHEARFATSGINVGLFCSTPAVALSRNLSRKRALEMLYTGEFIDANTALSWGLVNRVTDADELDAAVSSLALKIAAKSSSAVSIGKDLFYRQINQDLEDAYASASEAMACNMEETDARQGIDAFINKSKKR